MSETSFDNYIESPAHDALRAQRIAFMAGFLATMNFEELTEFHASIWNRQDKLDETANDVSFAVGELSTSDPDKAIAIITSLAEDSDHVTNRRGAVFYMSDIADKAPLELRLRLWDKLVRDEEKEVRDEAISMVIVGDTGYPDTQEEIPEDLDTVTDFGDNLTWRQALNLYDRYAAAEAGKNIHRFT